MKTRIAAATAAFVIGVASISSAMAFDRPTRYTGFAHETETTGTIYGNPDSRSPLNCPMSSAAEGNANQQHFPVKQYGQTAGGNRC